MALLKRESSEATLNEAGEVEQQLNVKETYHLLLRIIMMKPIRILAAVLLTVKAGEFEVFNFFCQISCCNNFVSFAGFAACDAVSSLKLVDAGVPKEKLALLVIPLVPLQIVLPLIISRYTTGPKPMEVYIKAYPYRVIFGLVASFIVWLTPYTFTSTGEVPTYYYVMLVINYGFYQVCLYSMFVAGKICRFSYYVAYK